MRQPRILMCPPDFYGIEYEINPWMSRSRGSSPERAAPNGVGSTTRSSASASRSN